MAVAGVLRSSHLAAPLGIQRCAGANRCFKRHVMPMNQRRLRTLAHAQEPKEDGVASATTPEAQPSSPASVSSSSGSSAAASEPTPVPESHPLQLSAQELLTELTDEQHFGKRGEVWLFAQLATIALILFPPFSLEGLVNLAATLLLTAGIVFIGYAVLSLGRNISPLPAPRKTHKLITSGMYSYVRHPMYGGLIMAGLGLAAITRNECRLALTLLLWIVLEQKTSWEERALTERYPTYKEYAAKVRKFIPYVY